MYLNNLKTAMLGVALLLATPLAAQENAAATAAAGQIRINADKVEFDRAKASSVYAGNVSLTQGRLSLTADRLEVYTADSRLSLMRAAGRPAVFSSLLADGRPVRGEAQTVEYDAKAQTLTLVGEGRLIQGENSIVNDRIVYNLKNESLSAGGEKSTGRVEVILQAPE